MVSQARGISTWIGVVETPDPCAAPYILPCPEQEPVELQQAVIEVRGGFWEPHSTPPPEDFLHSLIPTTTLTKSNAQIGFPNWSFQPFMPSNEQILTVDLAYPASEFVGLNDYNHPALLHLIQNNVGVKENADVNLVPAAWLPDQQHRYRREAVNYAKAYDEVVKRDEREMWFADLAYYANKGVYKLEKASREKQRKQTMMARVCRLFRAAHIDKEEDADFCWEGRDADVDPDDLTESSFCCIGHNTASAGYTPYPVSPRLRSTSMSTEDYLFSFISTSNASTYQEKLSPELTFPKRPLCLHYSVGNLYMVKQVTEYIDTVGKAGEWKLIANELQLVRTEKRRWRDKSSISPFESPEVRDEDFCPARRRKRVRRERTPHPRTVGPKRKR